MLEKMNKPSEHYSSVFRSEVGNAVYTYMPTSKLKLGPLRVPGLGTRIEAYSIQLRYECDVRYDFGTPQSRRRMLLLKKNIFRCNSLYF